MHLEFRRPQVDETLQGVIARILAQLPKAFHPQILTEIVGGRNRSVATDLPHGLRQLCRVLNLNESVIIRDHTILPLFRPFVSDQTYKNAEEAMLGDGRPHMLLGTNPCGGFLSENLRLCPVCAKVDQSRFGCYTWRRHHQIKTVRYCADHEIPLLETDVLGRSPFQFKYSTPLDIRKTIELSSNRSSKEDLLWISKQFRKLLIVADLPCPGPQKLADYYFTRIKELGFILANDRVAHFKLMDAIQTRYHRSVFEYLGCPINRAVRDNWVRRLIASPTMHPIHKHLLLIRFLGDDTLSLVHRSMDANRVTCSALLRPQFSQPHRKLLTRKRAQWIRIVKSDENKIRCKFDALYSWMWRHDREFLLRNKRTRRIQTKRRLNWHEIDLQMMENVHKAAKALRKEGKRCSWSRLASASGRPSILACRHPMIPRAINAATAVVQNAEDHAIVRVQQTIKRFNRSKTRLKPWRVAAAAGLGTRMKNIPAIQKLLHSNLKT